MWKSGAYGYLSDYLLWWIALASLVFHTGCFFKLFPKRRKRSRLFLGNALILFCILTFAGAVGESYYRFLVVETDAFGTSLVSKRWFQLYPKLNSLYFRDVEWTPRKPVGTRRIAFVGDSFVYGWGINNAEDRFTEIMQRRLDADPARRVEVMNMGWSAWDTQAEARALPDLIEQFALDEVVLCYLPNDIETLLPVTAEFDPRQAPRARYVHTECSYLLDYLFHRIVAPRSASTRSYWDWLADGYADPRTWQGQTDRLRELIQACRDRKVDLKVALLPLLKTGGERYDAHRIHSQLRDFFERLGVPVVDLLPTIPHGESDRFVVNPHDPHPNELAHRLFADAIWQAFYAR